MIDIVEAWLKSGKHAEFAGLKLRPNENPLLKGAPLSIVRGQAQAYYLTDDNNLDWILKKFTPARIPDRAYIKAIGSLVPRRPGFQSGYLRRILSKRDVSSSGFHSADFESWVENTVLMARINYDDWAALADKLRRGSATLTNDERLLLCRSLSENVGLLESQDLSHRDLSVTNVFVDVKALLVHLIDWDCLYHPSLTMPRNTTYGTEGYIAPFVKKSGALDPRVTWRPHADRFSMALLNAEFLCMDVGTPLRNEGGMFEQSELYGGGGPEIAQIIDRLKRDFPGTDALLEKALRAQSFDDCPSPAEWLALGGPTQLPAAVYAPAINTAPTTAPPLAVSPAGRGAFTLLDEAAFVKFDEGALAQLS
jgi:hypothetical protein